MDSRNFQFLFMGLAAAWTVLVIYALTLLMRERRIDAELKRLRSMIEDRERK